MVTKDVSWIYFDEKDKLRNVLRDHSLCLTTTTWTSMQNFNFMCITCHFINDDWMLHKRIFFFFFKLLITIGGKPLVE